MFHVIDEHFFMPLASPNRVVYWECICKLFSVMDHQLSFGVDRDVLVEELQYYFEQIQAAEHLEEVYRYVGRKPKRGLEQKNVKLEQEGEFLEFK